MGLSTPAKTGVANQIQHHLKGCNSIADETTDAAGGPRISTPDPIPSSSSCRIQEGKVLGLKVTTVNTPDVTPEEDGNDTTLGKEVREFGRSGDFIVVMVMGEESRDDGGVGKERMIRFVDTVFGEQAHR